MCVLQLKMLSCEHLCVHVANSVPHMWDYLQGRSQNGCCVATVLSKNIHFWLCNLDKKQRLVQRKTCVCGKGGGGA